MMTPRPRPRPRPHQLTATIGTVALLLGLLATPVLAGEAVCSLQATVGGGSATEVEVGEEVLIEGFGFPTGDVEVSFSVDGTFLRSVTATADATGFFEVTDTPQVGEEGLWAVIAVGIDEICSATTGFQVVGAPASPSASVAASVAASAAPTASTIPNVAVPTDGGSASPAIMAGLVLLVLALVARLAVRRIPIG